MSSKMRVISMALDFGAQGIGFAVQFLNQKIQPFAHAFLGVGR
jgi:hypothetical protein